MNKNILVWGLAIAAGVALLNNKKRQDAEFRAENSETRMKDLSRTAEQHKQNSEASTQQLKRAEARIVALERENAELKEKLRAYAEADRVKKPTSSRKPDFPKSKK